MAVIKKTINKCWWRCGEKGPPHAVCGDKIGKQCAESSKNKKIELPHDPAIPLLGVYLKKPKTIV